MQPHSTAHTPYPGWLAQRIGSNALLGRQRAEERDRLLLLPVDWEWTRHQAAALNILEAEALEVAAVGLRSSLIDCVKVKLRFKAMVQAHTDLANQIPQSQGALVQVAVAPVLTCCDCAATFGIVLTMWWA